MPSFLKDLVNGAIRTMSEMLSQYAGTAGLGTLPGMSAGAGIDKYLEARKEGYSIPRSFTAGGITTATEYITEKTPLEILGRPGLKLVDRLMKGLIADIPGEIEATLVEMAAVDQAILGKSYTRQEYLWALLDTVATAALATFGATGIIQPFIAATQQAQQAPEIKQSDKEKVPEKTIKKGNLLYAVTQKPAKEAAPSSPGTDSIQPSSEFVRPDIQLMPALKSLIDTGKLSMEDALEIDNVARQNHWSEDTVKQFYENAIKGLGIPNKDTASLEQMLIVAKVKEAVYKQNAEQYKQEIATNEKLLDQFYSRLKIQGGAPDKYETAANDFLKNLGDLKDLKPEEIIQKAQKEFALNLNRLDNPNLNFWTKYFLRANKKTLAVKVYPKKTA